MAAERGRAVHVVHARKAAVAGDGGADGEELDAARALVSCAPGRAGQRTGCRRRARSCCTRPTTARPDGWWPSTPTRSARAPSSSERPGTAGCRAHGRSSSRELLRHVRSDVLIINPVAAALACLGHPPWGACGCSRRARAERVGRRCRRGFGRPVRRSPGRPPSEKVRFVALVAVAGTDRHLDAERGGGDGRDAQPGRRSPAAVACPVLHRLADLGGSHPRRMPGDVAGPYDRGVKRLMAWSAALPPRGSRTLPSRWRSTIVNVGSLVPYRSHDPPVLAGRPPGDRAEHPAHLAAALAARRAARGAASRASSTTSSTWATPRCRWPTPSRSTR